MRIYLATMVKLMLIVPKEGTFPSGKCRFHYRDAGCVSLADLLAALGAYCRKLVGVAGFEPATPASRTQLPTREVECFQCFMVVCGAVK
jgi:hypothetical protein